MNIELLYVWIGENESGFIRNQGFHFSPEYRFEMTYLEKEGEYQLDCIRNEDYPNIWKRDNLCGLTAVVGENGTGKTSLMKTLLSPYTEESKLMVYTVGNRFLVWNHLNQKVRYWSDEVCENSNAETVQQPIYMTNAQGFQLKYWEGPLMFFTPDKDIRNHFVASFVESEPMQMPERFLDLYGKNKNIDFSKLAIVNYYHHQFKKTNGEKEKASESLLKVNSTLTIGLRRAFTSLYTKVYNKIENNRNMPIESREYLRLFRNMFQSSHSFLDRLWLIMGVELSYISGLWDFLYSDPITHATDLLDWYKSAPNRDEFIVSYYTQAVEELEELSELLELLEVDAVGDQIVLSYDRNPGGYMEFSEFISGLLYKSDSFVLRNLSIDLSELSSGERAMQNICAWLIIASNSVMRASILRDNNILLLLDEVDLYMHPEWQRKFLNFLEKELKLQFPEYQIQIVITTHSPLVLSDVPSGNIIYLGRKSDHCTVDGGPEVRETFGANIFTLMKDSFYLERSLGEFAYHRIREVIDDLQILRDWNTENPSFALRMIQEKYSYAEHREKCRNHKQLIGIIGEPVVRNKLQRLYAELFDEKPEMHYKKRVKDIRSVLQTMSAEEHQRFREELSSILAQMKDDRD